MLTDTWHREVCVRPWTSRFPLEPIVDDHDYRQAIAVLDRLFLLGHEKSREESEYFRALAQLAHEYECPGIDGRNVVLHGINDLDHRLQGQGLQAEQRGRYARAAGLATQRPQPYPAPTSSGGM